MRTCRLGDLRLRAVAALVLCWLVAGGCAPTFATRVPEVQIDKARLTALPADVQLNELSLGLGPKPTLTPRRVRSAAGATEAVNQLVKELLPPPAAKAL